MASVYAQGQTVRLTVTFRSPDGALADPRDPMIRVRAPNGVVLELAFMAAALERDDEGQYSGWVTPQQHGRWLWRGTGVSQDGTHTTVHQGYFDVTQGF